MRAFGDKPFRNEGHVVNLFSVRVTWSTFSMRWFQNEDRVVNLFWSCDQRFLCEVCLVIIFYMRVGWLIFSIFYIRRSYGKPILCEGRVANIFYAGLGVNLFKMRCRWFTFSMRKSRGQHFLYESRVGQHFLCVGWVSTFSKCVTFSILWSGN